MKKMRILSVVALLLCIVTVFASCGAGAVLKYVDIEIENDKPLATSTKLEYGTLLEANGELALFVDLQADKAVVKVFNVATNAVVYTKELTLADYELFDVSLYALDDLSYFVELNYKGADVVSAKLYAANGSTIAESVKDPEYIQLGERIILFNGAAYMVGKKGAIEKAFDVDEFGYLGRADEIEYVGEKYIYFGTETAVVVTEHNGTFVSAYDFKTYYNAVTRWQVLANGNIVIQYEVMLEDDVKSYDFEEESTDKLVKYDLVTEIFNVNKGNAKDVDVDFIISEMLFNVNTELPESLVEDFDLNYVYVEYIENKRVSDIGEMCVLDNNLKIKAAGSDIVDGGIYFGKVTDDVFVVSDRYGMTTFVKKSGKVIKSISSTSVNGATTKYIVTDESIYDYDFKKIYDIKGNGYDVEDVGDDFVILSKDTADGTEYARFYGGAVSVVLVANSTDSYEGVSVSGALYCIEVNGESGTTYNYYNGAGTLVAAYDSTLAIELMTENGFVLVEAGGNYYRLAPQA